MAAIFLTLTSPKITALAEDQITFEINIEAQSLGDALSQLASQTKIQLLFKSIIVEKYTSPPLRGPYSSIGQALNALLKDTQLKYQQIGSSTFIVQPLSSRSSVNSHANDQTKKELENWSENRDLLPEVIIVGETYHAICCRDTPTTSTKTFVSTMEIPASLEGIDSQSFRDRGNATLMETFRDYSSINITDQSGQINLRGFRVNDQSILKSGLPSVSRGITPIPLQNIEGIEVVKGATSTLYGHGQPGGVINLITKTPQRQPFTDLSASYGNYDEYIALDSNGPSPFNADLWQRLNLLVREERQHNRIDGSIQQIQLAPSYLYHFQHGETLGLNLEYNHQEIDGLRGSRAFDQALDGSQSETQLNFLYPNLVNVPYYEFSGSTINDFQKSDAIDISGKFSGSINDLWDYSLATFYGKSKINVRASNDLLIWFNPFFDTDSVFIADAIYNAPNKDSFQNHFIALREKFEKSFLEKYAEPLGLNSESNIISAIFGDGTTPAWSNDSIRFYQQLEEVPQKANQFGLESNVHRLFEWGSTTHEFLLGFLYQQREWKYKADFFYSGELYERGTELIKNGDYVTGFALRRYSSFNWYYPYGVDIKNNDIVLPDNIAKLAGLPLDARYPVDARWNFYDNGQKTQSLGVYLQDHMDLSKQWRLLASVGVYRYRRSFEMDLYNTAAFATGDHWFGDGVHSIHTDHSMTPQLGLVYLPSPNLSFYSSAGRQFDIVDGLMVNQKPLAPEKTENNEIGFKWWPLETFNVTSTYFKLKKANYAAPGNANGGFGNLQQIGVFTSTGHEMNISGYIIPHIKLSANYAKSHFENKAETGISKSLLNVLRGGVPAENGSVWLQYHNIPFGKQGWSIGTGVTYIGMRRYELQELYVQLDPILLIDASMAYRNDDFRLALNIDNITNKDWITGASSKMTGVPDAAQASAQISAFYLGHGYGTRVRLSTEMYF